ncbi:hypothetical protein AXF22_06400 [Prevotella scopos JCM 17725]|nr:hypothetical protein AXF22_06400 [Prevotella scopos JCM 17725]
MQKNIIYIFSAPFEQSFGAFFFWILDGKNRIKAKKACLPTSLFIIQKHYEIIYFANKIII